MRPVLVVVALLLATQVRADVVILRDGSQRSGTVEICDEDGCRLSGKRIAAAEIRAVYFGSARPVISRPAGVVMLDGSVRKGAVRFVNRGVVDLDGEEIDRSSVAGVVFAGDTTPPPDVLLLRNGTIRKGAITACNAASCTLDGSATPLAEVAWIGFAQEELAPPQSSGSDEVHKIDGSVIAARLTAASATSLSTTRGPVARTETAWVHLAPLAPPQQPQPDAYGAPQSPPPGAPAPPQPPATPPPGGSPAPPPGQQPPPSSGGRASTGWPIPKPGPLARPTRGGLWTGQVIARYRAMNHGILTKWDIDARVRLREVTSPLVLPNVVPLRSVGSLTVLHPEGTVLTEKVSCRGGDVTCEGEGTITITGEDNVSCGSFWWKNDNYDTTAAFGFDIPRNGTYSICIGAPDSAEFTVTYTNSFGSHGYPSRYVSPVIGRYPISETSHFMDPDVRSFPGGVARMAGTFFKPANVDFGSLSVSWSICRETGNCPPPGPLPPDPEDADDCPPPASQQALLERALMELKAKAARAAELEAQYKRIENEARQWEGDYIDVMRDCALFSLAKTLTGFLLGNFAPRFPPTTIASPTGPNSLRIDTLPGIEPGKTFVNFVNFIEKLSDGDASWLLPDTEFGPGGADWVSLEDIWDGAGMGWSYLESQGASPAQLREQMLSCGSPSIAGATEGALKYLRLMEDMRPLGDAMNTVKNDIRNLEVNQIEGDLWPKYRQECLRYEECREGGDPSRCNQMPGQ